MAGVNHDFSNLQAQRPNERAVAPGGGSGFPNVQFCSAGGGAPLVLAARCLFYRRGRGRQIAIDGVIGGLARYWRRVGAKIFDGAGYVSFSPSLSSSPASIIFLTEFLPTFTVLTVGLASALFVGSRSRASEDSALAEPAAGTLLEGRPFTDLGRSLRRHRALPHRAVFRARRLFFRGYQ